MALVQTNGLRMAYGGTEVLHGVDIEMRPGEVHAIVGENGAGKSTVAKLIAGMHRPTGGTISLDGREVRFASPREAIDAGVALIHQEPLTFPDLDVSENIFVGHHPGRHGVDWRAMHAKASEILASVGFSRDVRTKAGSLSIADQQMVELAFALSREANVLMFDETTAALTPREAERLFDVMRSLRDQGRTLSFVSHRLGEVFAIADRITVLRDGDKVAELDPRTSTPADVVRLMIGRDLVAKEDVGPRKPKRRADPLLRVRELTLPGKFWDVSFDLARGEIVGLAGLVGAGRTDVARSLFGLAHARGIVEVDGAPRSIRSPRSAIQQGIALVPEDRQHEGLLLLKSVRENLVLATLRGLMTRRSEERATTESWAEKLFLRYRDAEQAVLDLSGGNQQKVVLAKWLATNPRILILDEPTRGVDVGAKEEVHRLIRGVAEQGIGVLLISSDLPELLELSTRVLVMRAGRLVADYGSDEASPEKVMASAVGEAV